MKIKSKILKLLKILISSFLLFIPNLEGSISTGSFEYLSKEIPDEIVINVSSKEYRRYLKSIVNAERDRVDKYRDNILQKYKRWRKGTIIINNEKYKIQFRIQGEWKDHLKFPTSTIAVKLKEKNIGGITNFKLFLPETRMGEREVFWTILLNKLNFLSPFTKIVDVTFNGVNYKALFQEQINNEFLERNNYKASPILKRHELWDLTYESKEFEKLDDFNQWYANWIVDNPSILKTKSEIIYASNFIKEINFVNFQNFSKNYDYWRYINYKHAPHHLNYTLKFKYANHYYASDSMININRYDLYFDHLYYIEKIFKNNFTGKIYPIYYDGMPRLNIFDYSKKNCSKVKNLKFTKTISFLYENNTGLKLKNFHYCIINDALKNLNFNKDFFEDELEKNYKKTQQNFSHKIKIEKKIYNYLQNKQVRLVTEKSTRSFIENFNKIIQIFSFQYKENFYTCLVDLEFKVENCHQISIDLYKKFLSGKYKPFVLKNLNNFNLYNINLGSIEVQHTYLANKSPESQNILDQDKVYVVNLSNNSLKEINFNLKSEAKLLLTGDIKNVNLRFNNIDFKKKENIYRNDKNLFTSCVTFYKANFVENVNIISNDFQCEDSINIVNSEGYIENIFVNNSKFDGLDVDFSNIHFNKILIKNSGNDCVDLSFGDYSIKNLESKNCGDKSLSIGEGSILNLKSINSKNSLIGIASKDNSELYLDDGYFDDTETCIALYQKKQEFGGGLIEYKNLKCLNYKKKFEIDKKSKLIKKN